MDKINYYEEIKNPDDVKNENDQKKLTVHDFLQMVAFFPSDLDDALQRLRGRIRACEACVFAPDRRRGDCYMHTDIFCNNWYKKQMEHCTCQADIDAVNRVVECREQRCRDKLYNFLITPLSEKGLALYREKAKEKARLDPDGD